MVPLLYGLQCVNFDCTLFPHAGGNQRELARAKNAKKLAAQGKGKATTGSGNQGQGLESRKERDADIMREKQKKAAEAKK